MALFVHQLSQHEERVLSYLTEKYVDTPLIFKRLQIVLLSNQRLKTSEISERLAITGTTASHWIKQYNQSRLECFEREISEAYLPQKTERALSAYQAELANQAVINSIEDESAFVSGITYSQMQEIQQLQELYKGNARVLHHLQAVLLSNDGFEVSTIAEILSFPPQLSWRIRTWIEQFNLYGTESLVTKSDKIWLAQKQKLLPELLTLECCTTAQYLTA